MPPARVQACAAPHQPGFRAHSLVLPASLHAWLSLPHSPSGISPAASALENWAVCLAPLEGRRRQENRQQFRSRHNSWPQPNMTDLPLGRLFHLLFNARNKYLHDPALEGTRCDNSLHLPAKRHRHRVPKPRQGTVYAVLRAGPRRSGRKHFPARLQGGEREQGDCSSKQRLDEEGGRDS